MAKTVAIACDHAGFALKGAVIAHLEAAGNTVVDCGTYSDASCDYPDYASAACREVVSGECDCAVLICGTGVGMSIVANKFDGIRAACCSDTFSARFTRLHNDANVLCFGARVAGEGLALDMVDLFMSTPYENAGNHPRRVAKIAEIEKTHK